MNTPNALMIKFTISLQAETSAKRRRDKKEKTANATKCSRPQQGAARLAQNGCARTQT
jgi:hypothetical protein